MYHNLSSKCESGISINTTLYSGIDQSMSQKTYDGYFHEARKVQNYGIQESMNKTSTNYIILDAKINDSLIY